MPHLSLPLPFCDFFEPDNYDEITQTYFGTLRSSGKLYSDPSGWMDTYSEAASRLSPVQIRVEDYGRYYLDIGRTLGPDKTRLLELLSKWEGVEMSDDNVTLSPSVSAASLMVLATLKTLNVSSLLFETPCYFATADQAEYLQFHRHFIPTYLQDNFRADGILDILAENDHIAVWITQPRASLGLNQDRERLWKILTRLGRNSYLVIDEATDQSFPAVLGSLRSHPNSSRLIKLKNFSKPMGLNGLRIACILHAPSLRSTLIPQIETFGGSIDLHSLKTAANLAGDVERFQLMLRAANSQVTKLRIHADRLSQGTNVSVVPLENGYIGAVALPLARSKKEFSAGRQRFLRHCRDRATPVIIGPSMYIASDHPTEYVRINYLSHPQHILRAMEVLSEFSIC